MFMANDGRIGIGTNTPSVNGKVTITGDNNTSILIAPGMKWADPDTGWSTIDVLGSRNLGLWDNVFVRGTLSASSNINASQPVPDYVFQHYFTGKNTSKEDYHFQNLAAVENFIVKHHHLPGVPSADEIEKKGNIDLVSSIYLNLEKIEELFLYVIELKKENEALKTRIKALEDN